MKTFKRWLLKALNWVCGPLENGKPKPRVRQSKTVDHSRIQAAQAKRDRRRERNKRVVEPAIRTGS